MNTLNAYLTSFTTIVVEGGNLSDFFHNNLKIENGENKINIINTLIIDGHIQLELDKEISIKRETILYVFDTAISVNYIPLYDTSYFNKLFYTDETLGCIYNKEESTFRVWSPIAIQIELLLYKNGESQINEDIEVYPMSENNGLFSISINKDLEGYFYVYRVHLDKCINETIDPYATSCGINGLRGHILDLNKTNPVNWEKDLAPNLNNFTDAIIYEASIRDFTINPNSKVQNKGNYLGLTENGIPLSHIKDLGITHIQFMPMFDFSYISVDEKNIIKYNWGYDPQNYNIPEGIYSTNPYNPYCRIKELKFLIQSLHQNGLRINMDVVYNHMYSPTENSFQKIFPGYYFRFNKDGSFVNGSACDNDTASEHLMMRKFILDSVTYWAKEYHIDGFRFDLMGLHDVDTMNLVRETLNNLGKKIMLYGEGWYMNTTLLDTQKACLNNSYKMPHIGHFNDTLRDCVKGSVFEKMDGGFASGKPNMEDTIKSCVKGIFSTPDQSINYVSCHDNNTLWDKINLSSSNESLETKKDIQKLCNAIVFTCQGIPFMNSGVEFCRTKDGVENSFKSADNINWIDWDRKNEFKDVYDYYKRLIAFRKAHPALRMTSETDIRNNIEFLNDTPKNTVAFILKNHANGDSFENILIIYNANKYETEITLPQGIWHVVGNKSSIGEVSLLEVQTSIKLQPISMTIMRSDLNY